MMFVAQLVFASVRRLPLTIFTLIALYSLNRVSVSLQIETAYIFYRPLSCEANQVRPAQKNMVGKWKKGSLSQFWITPLIYRFCFVLFVF